MPDPVARPPDYRSDYHQFQGVQQTDDDPGHQPGRYHHHDEPGHPENRIAGERPARPPRVRGVDLVWACGLLPPVGRTGRSTSTSLNLYLRFSPQGAADEALGRGEAMGANLAH